MIWGLGSTSLLRFLAGSSLFSKFSGMLFSCCFFRTFLSFFLSLFSSSSLLFSSTWSILSLLKLIALASGCSVPVS